MQDINLRFPSLKVLILFKQQSQVKELRIDTYEKTLTGRFPESEVQTAIGIYKAAILDRQQLLTVRSMQTAAV